MSKERKREEGKGRNVVEKRVSVYIRDRVMHGQQHSSSEEQYQAAERRKRSGNLMGVMERKEGKETE